jgi:hypothetical protein
MAPNEIIPFAGKGKMTTLPHPPVGCDVGVQYVQYVWHTHLFFKSNEM